MSDAVELSEILASVSLWKDVPVEVSPLPGGLTNTNYVVGCAGRKYVLRVPGRATELLDVDRENERHNAEAAAETGAAPRLLEYLPRYQAMVLQFVEGETMSGERLRSPEMAARIAASLRRLHAARPFAKDFDMCRLTRFYVSICRERGIAMPEGFDEHLSHVPEIERALSRNPPAAAPCHNDLLAENYIDDGRRLWIVDFEYSGNNDPCFELGNTAQECEYGDDLKRTLCRAYFGEATPRRLARMNLHAVIADVGWALSAAIQRTISAIDYDFWSWATLRSARARAAFGSRSFYDWLEEA